MISFDTCFWYFAFLQICLWKCKLLSILVLYFHSDDDRCRTEEWKSVLCPSSSLLLWRSSTLKAGRHPSSCPRRPLCSHLHGPLSPTGQLCLHSAQHNSSLFSVQTRAKKASSPLSLSLSKPLSHSLTPPPPVSRAPPSFSAFGKQIKPYPFFPPSSKKQSR